MDEKDIKKLNILLEHWVEHNNDHAEEFREWAEKAREYMGGSISEKIDVAADRMTQANESLKEAITAMKEST